MRIKAFILAAGYGTRLAPLTKNFSKPALPILGIPIFWFSAWHFSRTLGIKEIIINTCHAPHSLGKAAADKDLKKFTGVGFIISDETKQILGTSGALKKIQRYVGHETLCVVNGDALFFPNWSQLIEYHRIKKALLTIHVRAFDCSSYTEVKINSDGLVTQFCQDAHKGLMFSGAYVMEPAVFDLIPEGPSDLKTTVFESLIKKQKLFAFRDDVEWFDTGSKKEFVQTQFQLTTRLPTTKELICVKMKEISPGCYIPKAWKPNFQLKAPVVMTGRATSWLKHSESYGPFFVGIEPPTKQKDFPKSNAVVLADQVYTF